MKEGRHEGILRNYKAHRFEIPPDDFFFDISRDDYWFPVELTPWNYLPSYRLLPKALQKRYNQLYALGTNEVFAIFEVEFVSSILHKLKKTVPDNPYLVRSLEKFREEEIKHAEMFHLLNECACPEYYGQGKKYFLSRSAHPSGIILLNLFKKFPKIFGIWVWIALFFEERSLVYSKYFLTADNVHLNRQFREIHKLHMMEEAHHVQLDEVFVHYFYRPLSPWKRKLTGWLLDKIVKSYAAPRRMSKAIARVLIQEFPDHQGTISQCLSELPSLKSNRDFQEISLGPKATERTRRLMSMFPEFQKALRALSQDSQPNPR